MVYMPTGKHHFGDWLYWELMKKSGSKSAAAAESRISQPLITELCKQAEPAFRTGATQQKLAHYLGLSVDELMSRWKREAVPAQPPETRGAHLRPTESRDRQRHQRREREGLLADWAKRISDALNRGDLERGATPEQIRTLAEGNEG